MAAKALLHKFLFIASIGLLLSGCSDHGGVFDQSNEIENRNWSYSNKVRYDIKVDDSSASYSLFLNLRVGGDYKYSNIFVMVKISGPGLKTQATRYETRLADPDGKWLGDGSGGLYSYQSPFNTNFHFPAKGVYHFEIEQNMRDNPLRGVSDVGLRVGKNGQ